MSYRIKQNSCEGWYQPVFVDSKKQKHFGAKWPTYKEAYDAIIFHSKKGKFPSEVKEKTVSVPAVCNKCGKLLAENQ